MLKSQKMGYSGKLPTAENEIVVQKSFLDSLGYSYELGQIIKIPFSDGKTRDFRLTGILDVEMGDIGQYMAIISKELVKQQYGNEASFDFYIGLRDAPNLSEEEAAAYANALAETLHISDENTMIRSTYFHLRDNRDGRTDMLFYLL